MWKIAISYARGTGKDWARKLVTFRLVLGIWGSDTEMSSRYREITLSSFGYKNIWGGVQSVKGFATLRNVVNLGCFPFCQTNQLETSGIIKRKWNDIFQLKQSFQSNQAIHLHLDRNFDYCLAKRDWTREFWKWNSKSWSERTDRSKTYDM